MTIEPRRTLIEENEVVSTAVIAVLHALMEMAGDRDLSPEYRLGAANSVLMYASDAIIPEEPEESEEVQPDGQSSEES